MSEMKSWSNYTLNKVTDVFYFFDVLALQALQLRAEEDIEKCATFALFIVVNYHSHQVLPVLASHRTYLLLIFHVFFIFYFKKTVEDNQSWTNTLIEIGNQLKLAKKGAQYFHEKYNLGQVKEDLARQK